MVWARIASTICWPTVWTGLSEVIGSWKIIDILLPRSLRRSSADSVSTSRLPNSTASASTLPGGLGTRPMTESDVTLLPQPDSPTRPTVRPRGTREADAVDGAEQAAVGRKMGLQAADLEELFHQKE